MSRRRVMDKAFRTMAIEEQEKWFSTFPQPLPIPGGSHSLALMAYEVNRKEVGFGLTQEDLPLCDRILVVSGGPGAGDPERVEDAICRFMPDTILATFSHLNKIVGVLEREPKIPYYVVDCEIDAFTLRAYYPKGWSGNAIWYVCKQVTDWCDPAMIFWANAAPGSDAEKFDRDEIGVQMPMRTTGEAALWLACFKMGAKAVGTIGIQNPLPDYEKQRKFTLDILNRFDGVVEDYEGNGVVHEWLGRGDAALEKPMDCTTCPHYLPTAPAWAKQGRCLVEDCDRGVR